MRDTISREAALKLILSGRVGDDSHFECPAECNSMLEWAANEVAKMPAADVPERKVGNWIGIDDEPYEDFECDQCGTTYYTGGTTWDLPYFCPNCGAKMNEVK